MCVWGYKRDLWEGCLGVRMSGGVRVWTCVLSGCTCMIIGCCGIWVWNVLNLGAGILVQRCGWSMVCLGVSVDP